MIFASLVFLWKGFWYGVGVSGTPARPKPLGGIVRGSGGGEMMKEEVLEIDEIEIERGVLRSLLERESWDEMVSGY